jgi:hypothetical protein
MRWTRTESLSNMLGANDQKEAASVDDPRAVGTGDNRD